MTASRINTPIQREAVEPTKRKPLSSAHKLRIWAARHGLCVCCGEEISAFGPGVVYDHTIPLELGGDDADGNIAPIHAEPCNKIKTRMDARYIAKARRLRAREEGTRRARKEIKGAGFQTNLSRGFDGVVRPK